MSASILKLLSLLFAPAAAFFDWISWADDRESRARVWVYPLGLLALAATMAPYFALILWTGGNASLATLGVTVCCFLAYAAMMHINMWWVDAFCSPIASSSED